MWDYTFFEGNFSNIRDHLDAFGPFESTIAPKDTILP
jgi:hypothetical protein